MGGNNQKKGFSLFSLLVSLHGRITQEVEEGCGQVMKTKVLGLLTLVSTGKLRISSRKSAIIASLNMM
ncbi:hypothetical protein Patl1_24613 [Pistacia atlantica]|uniref:Uncharacterized protein n=1 Tax=Pistacia atlantica TaxID=434234 RepID=A0ACC0ZZ27_9ROSI|nr:hypothetical protein Patl1_24613 [Pistacia atlantica]